jgi:hypothetical protein
VHLQQLHRSATAQQSALLLIWDAAVGAACRVWYCSKLLAEGLTPKTLYGVI